MQASTRHDLRDPVATIYMIASTASELGATLPADTVGSFGNQVAEELNRLKGLCRRHGADLCLDRLEKEVLSFGKNPLGSGRALSLEKACEDLLADLERQ